MNEQELKDMKLHELIKLAEELSILRVCNGWLYRSYHFKGGDWFATETFVPEISIIQEHNVPRLRSF